jgi:Raf kinase inhibitor-like YbhB/YbcL family protein
MWTMLQGQNDNEKALYLLVLLTFLFTCPGLADSGMRMKGGKKMEITSTTFKHGARIPAKYTCDGVDVSPPLQWDNAPAGTKSVALICDDPDAPMGTWVHWVIYDIPASITNLPEKIPPLKELANGAKQGMNDFRAIGYGGPCPPSGEHRYFFKIYALDGPTGLRPGATKAQLLSAMQGHILGEAHLMGKYKR